MQVRCCSPLPLIDSVTVTGVTHYALPLIDRVIVTGMPYYAMWLYDSAGALT